MSVSIDRSDPQRLVLTLRHPRYAAGALTALVAVGAWYAALDRFGDRLIPDFSDIRSPVAWLLLILPLAVLPSLLRNLRWALAGEKVVFDGTRADVLKNGAVVCEFKDVRAVTLHMGPREHRLTLDLPAAPWPVDADGDRARLDEAGRAAAGFLKRSFHILGSA
jgi:hypothetical protein